MADKEPKKEPAKPTPVETSKKSAHEMLLTFMQENGIELDIRPMDSNIKRVSDGSIIIDKPLVTAKFVNGR